jgi:hypothetical protein
MKRKRSPNSRSQESQEEGVGLSEKRCHDENLNNIPSKQKENDDALEPGEIPTHHHHHHDEKVVPNTQEQPKNKRKRHCSSSQEEDEHNEDDDVSESSQKRTLSGSRKRHHDKSEESSHEQQDSYEDRRSYKSRSYTSRSPSPKRRKRERRSPIYSRSPPSRSPISESEDDGDDHHNESWKHSHSKSSSHHKPTRSSNLSNNRSRRNNTNSNKPASTTKTYYYSSSSNNNNNNNNEGSRSPNYNIHHHHHHHHQPPPPPLGEYQRIEREKRQREEREREERERKEREQRKPPPTSIVKNYLSPKYKLLDHDKVNQIIYHDQDYQTEKSNITQRYEDYNPKQIFCEQLTRLAGRKEDNVLESTSAWTKRIKKYKVYQCILLYIILKKEVHNIVQQDLTRSPRPILEPINIIDQQIQYDNAYQNNWWLVLAKECTTNEKFHTMLQETRSMALCPAKICSYRVLQRAILNEIERCNKALRG